jgi:hypothetical protein
MSPSKHGDRTAGEAGSATGNLSPSTKSRLRFCSDSISREGTTPEENLVAIADHYKAILRLLVSMV